MDDSAVGGRTGGEGDSFRVALAVPLLGAYDYLAADHNNLVRGSIVTVPLAGRTAQ